MISVALFPIGFSLGSYARNAKAGTMCACASAHLIAQKAKGRGKVKKHGGIGGGVGGLARP